MSTRCIGRIVRVIATVMIVLTLVVGCGKAEPTVTLVPPTNTPVPPTATPANTTVPPTSTPIPPTPEPPPTATPAAEPGVTTDTWFKTYGGNQNDVGNDVLLADDGGFFIVGATDLEFEPEQRGDVYLIKTNAAGETLWEKTYGGEGYEAGTTVFQTSDGGLIISGVTNSFGAGGMDVYLIKVDQGGNKLWSKTFGGLLDEMATAQQMADGSYILVGNIVDPDDFVADPGAAGYGGLEGRSNIYLAKLDADGDELWSHAYGGENNVLVTAGVQMPDGGFLILATIMYFPDSGDDVLLLRVDENGNEVWSRTWEEGTGTAYDLIYTSDANYLIAGSYAPLGDMADLKEDFLFIKVDPDGNEIWTSIFGDPDMIDYGVVLAETEDGGYITVGERTRDRYTWEADLSLVKIDENGQLLWERRRTASHTMLSTILQHPDGGYIIAGSTFRDPVFNILLIKTDSEGSTWALQTSTATVAPPTDTPSPTDTSAPTDTPVSGPAPTATTTPLPPLSGSGDGMIAFTSERDGNSEIYIMNEDGSDQRNLTHHPASDDAPHWSPDGSQIAFSSDRSDDYDIYIVDADGASLQRLTQNPAVDAHPTWSPDGTRIAFVSLRDGNAEIYAVNADGSNLQRLTRTEANEFEFDWAPDGRQIVFASSEGDYASIHVMDSDGSGRRQLAATDAHDFYPRWSPDGTRIAFLSTRDGHAEEIYVMDSDGRNQRRLTTNDAFDGAPSWSPDGTRLVFASDRDGNHEIYAMHSDGANVRRLTNNTAADRKPAWRPVVQATTNAPVQAAISADTVDQVERLHTLSGHSDRVMTLAFSGDGVYVASSSRDKTIKLWDVKSGQEVHTFSMKEVGMNGIAFSPDGSLLASADAIWDVESKQVVHTLERGRQVPGPVAFSPDGSLLAVALVNQPIKLWDVASGQVVRTFDEQADNAAFSIAFSPDGTLLAAGGLGGTVRLWNVESGQIAGAIEYGDESGVHDVAFSPDGRVLASGGTNPTLRLWDVASRQAIRTLRLGDGLFGVAFSPDGTILASAGGIGGVRLWGVESGRMLRTLSHDDELMAVAFSPDGTLLASGGYDNQIYLWGIPR